MLTRGARGWLAVRWLAVVPLWFVGVWSGLFVGAWLALSVVDLCPREDVVSGMCFAWWVGYANTAAFCIGAGLGATLGVALPALAAPRWRRPLAILAFVVGVGFAFAMTDHGRRDTAPFAVATLAGLAVVWRVHARERTSRAARGALT